jgi:hypothetical protein
MESTRSLNQRRRQQNSSDDSGHGIDPSDRCTSTWGRLTRPESLPLPLANVEPKHEISARLSSRLDDMQEVLDQNNLSDAEFELVHRVPLDLWKLGNHDTLRSPDTLTVYIEADIDSRTE